MILACGVALAAQGPTYNLGTPPTPQMLLTEGGVVGPDGQGLPPGSGTAKQGAAFFAARGCTRCHGSTGMEGPAPVLVGERSGIRGAAFAPTIWNTIRQMMPLDRHQERIKFSVLNVWFGGGARDCCLTPDEVYALTAYLLYRNDIIQEDAIMDAKALPQVQMPNRTAYAPPTFLNSTWTRGLRKAMVK
jgi:cytochrome c